MSVRAVALITARLKSKRLPRKALLPIGGKALIDHQLTRLRKVVGIDEIVLCTSDLEEDEPLVMWAIERRIPFLRGDAVDVMERLRAAARFSKAETLFCVTADNPFISPEHGAAALRFHLAHQMDFTRCEGIPIGTYGYVLQALALDRACSRKADIDTEIWGPYFSPEEFRCGTMSFPSLELGQGLRLTVDTPEDYALACRLVEDRGPDVTLEQTYEWAKENVLWSRLNRHVIQRPPPTPRFRTEA